MNFFEFYNQIKDQKFPKLKLTWETNKENFSSFLMSEATKGLVKDISNWAEENPALKCHNCRQFGHLSKECPNETKRATCILCGKDSHDSFDCNEINSAPL